MVDSDVKLLRSGDLIEADIDDDKVMMSVESGMYFGLNPVAARVWELLAQPRNMTEVVEVLTQEFDVDPDQCRSDVAHFIEQLNENKLISVQA